jgi:hypothetical protein
VGTLGFFILHTLVWVTKELYQVVRERNKPEDETSGKAEDEQQG